MNGKKIKKFLKAGITISIILSFLMPTMNVVADDTTPPEITGIFQEPEIGVLPLYYWYIYCSVTDNPGGSGIADVRVNITGPDGFDPVNESMDDWGGNLYGYDTPPTIAGTYYCYIWAIDNSGNAVTSDVYHSLIFDQYMDFVYVDDDNIMGPWDGTEDHPFRYINDGITVVNSTGTVFVKEGIYQEITTIPKSLELVGEDKDNTIFDRGGTDKCIILNEFVEYVNITNFTLRNGQTGIELNKNSNVRITNCNIHDNGKGVTLYFGQTTGNTIRNCNFYNNNEGIYFYDNPHDNLIHHNNFVNNTEHVESSSGSNMWDDGIIGNYWDDYRDRYPDATIDTENATWNTPYVIDTNEIDNHPWILPDGVIDQEPPVVTVIYPNGGEILVGEILIEWNALDNLAPNLNGCISIEYSYDSGATWFDLASELEDIGNYTWNTTNFGDSDEYLIKIIANDWFLNTGSDISDDVFSIDNNPPLEVDAGGPYGNVAGEAISFSGSAIGGLEPYSYYWDFGNGDFSEEQNPNYSYDEPGVYDVVLTVTDSQIPPEIANDTTTANILSPGKLEIGEITGGIFQVSAEIKNIGEIELNDVEWSINIKGGIIDGIRVKTEDIINTLNPGYPEIIIGSPIFGLGKVNITIIADNPDVQLVKKEATAFVIGPFILKVTELE